MIREIREKIIVLLLGVSISLNVLGATWLYRNSRHSINQRVEPRNLTNEIKGISTVKETVAGDNIELLDIPKSDFGYLAPGYITEDKYQQALYVKDDVKYAITYLGHRVESAHFSPSYTELGFFYLPEDHFLSKINLAILNIDTKTVKDIYQGDTWTSNWEWKGDEAIIVKRKCGTRCMNVTVFDINTGKQLETYRVY